MQEEKNNDMEIKKEWRNLLKILAALLALFISKGTRVAAQEKENRAVGGPTRVPSPAEEKYLFEQSSASQDPLVRMQRELKRALKKPLHRRKWAMVIDLRKCVGCNACTVACVAENKLPPGVVYRPVIEEEIGSYPNVARRFIPRPCMHCGNPPCTPVCPVKATWKRPDGIVVIDYDRCIGCRYCLTACPYNARTFDFGEFFTKDAAEGGGTIVGRKRGSSYEKTSNFEYGEPRKRRSTKSPIGNARKCHFCLHRIEKGLLPQCVTTCIGRATYFGDANDSESLVSELISKPNATRLKEELGTNPSVYYLL